MPNVNPLVFDRAMTIRVDDDFKLALDELRALMRPVPTKSDAIRKAVMEMLEKERRRARK